MGSVDVAIPSYQYADYLGDSARSVLTQGVDTLRLLIIDNGSTDGSQDVATRIADHDARVTLFLNDENRGMFDSYNRAVDWVSSDYCVILDADDFLAAGALPLAIEFLDRHPDVVFAYGVEGRLDGDELDAGRCDSRTTAWEVETGAEYIRQTCRDSFCDIGAPALVIRTEALKKAGYFNEKLIRTNDFELYLRLAMLGDVAHTNRVLGVRRIHDNQLSAPFDAERIKDFIEHERAFDSFFSGAGAALPNAAALNALAHRRTGDYAYWYAVSRWLCGRPDARAAFAYARDRRGKPTWLPPVGFLLRRRWVRSVRRWITRRLHGSLTLGRGFVVPTVY